MPTLMELLTQPQSEAQPQPQQDEIQRLLAAKSGKAGTTGTVPQASNIGEQVATEGAQADLASQILKGQQVGVATEQQQSALQQQLSQAKEATTQEYEIKRQQLNDQTKSLLAGANRSDQELEFRKDASRLEQAATIMSLQNKQYVQEIQQTGALRRLEDKNAYEAESLRIAFGDETQRTLQEYNWKTDLSQSKRDWDFQIQQMDASMALDIAMDKLKKAGKQQLVQGISGVAGAGVSAYGNQKSSGSPEPTAESEASYPENY